MNSWHSYTSIYNVGHAAVSSLFLVPVDVEEKVDGSQFSFGRDESGVLFVRSKGAVMEPSAPEKMFAKAVDSISGRDLHPGWTYRGEYLQKPKHNTLCYSRVPNGNIIIFDINTGEEEYLDYFAKKAEAERIGLECVPLLYSGVVDSPQMLRDLLDRESVLGGQKIEGVVVKPTAHNLFGPDKKCLYAKFVSEAFKEIHGKEWRKSNPTNGDILEQLGDRYLTHARWNKAAQHLRERGEIEDSPRDIGALLKEVPLDIEKERADDIKERLYAWAWPHIRRKVTRGLPEWYKQQLLNKQFETNQ